MHGKLRLSHAMIAAFALAIPIATFASSRPDAWITMKAKTALYVAQDIKGTAINVDTINGRVTLYGTVNDEKEKARAAEEVNKIEGVADVRNLLQVASPSGKAVVVKRSDDRIKLLVQKRLKSDRSLDDSTIAVKSVSKGVIVLNGKSSSLDDSQRALYHSASEPGVVRVISEMEVADSISDEVFRTDETTLPDAGRRNAGGVASDLWIISSTKMKLAADARTPATDVNVDSRDGVVVLFGVAPSQESKAAAAEIAGSVSGVRRVENQIEVVSPVNHDMVQARDEEIQDSVKKSLKDRGDQENADISVEVVNGVVRLSGTVPTWQRNLSAVYAARSVTGVRSVRNELKVVTVSAAKS